MPRSLVWTLAGALLALLAVETVMLFRPLPPAPPPPPDLAESIRTLERRAVELADAYDRLEEELRRYIRRAPPPSRDMATETILRELRRLGEEVALINRMIVREPDRVLVIPSIRLDIEKLGERMAGVEARSDRLRAGLARRWRWILYLVIGNGLIALAILARLARPARTAGGATSILEDTAPAP